MKNELLLGSRPSGRIRGDMIQKVKAFIWKLETLNKKHYIKHLIISHIILRKEWARSVLNRMGFTKRHACSKSKVLPANFLVEMENVPGELIINWDQTAMKVCPSCNWTMKRCGTKWVEITSIDDKRQITAVFGCILLLGSFYSFN